MRGIRGFTYYLIFLGISLPGAIAHGDYIVLPPENLNYSIPAQNISKPYVVTVSPEIPTGILQTLSFKPPGKGFLKLVSTSETSDCVLNTDFKKALRFYSAGGHDKIDFFQRQNQYIPVDNLAQYDLTLEYSDLSSEEACTYITIRFEVEFYETIPADISSHSIH